MCLRKLGDKTAQVSYPGGDFHAVSSASTALTPWPRNVIHIRNTCPAYFEGGGKICQKRSSAATMI